MSGIIIRDNDPILLREKPPIDTLIPSTMSDRDIEKRCYAVLWKHYPGAPWRVDANSSRGTVDIFNLALSSKYGVRWKIGRIYADPDLHWVKMAGGELLERARISRGRFDEDETEVGWVDGIMPQDQPINGIAL